MSDSPKKLEPPPKILKTQDNGKHFAFNFILIQNILLLSFISDDHNEETHSDDSDDCGSICDTQAIAIGIDLGTTNSCVAAIVEDRSVVLNDPETNRFLIPSYVSFDESGYWIGEPAKMKAAENALNTIFDSKRLIGRTFDDPHVQNDLKFWPFHVTDSARGPTIQVTHCGEIQNLSPIQIASFILRKLKNIAEHHLGTAVTDAVITVPANFNNSQREATKTAGRIAGMNVIRVLNEPTAAAMAYSLDRANEECTICVYDLGGGTFDVTIITFKSNGAIRVRSTAGNPHLGGEDFDNEMVKHVINHIQTLDDFKDFKASHPNMRWIRSACVQAKHVVERGNSHCDQEFV